MDFVLHVSAVVRLGDRIALVQEGKPSNRGKWNLPGGHLEKGEGLIEGTEREIREELGQALSLNGFLGVYTGLGTAHCLNFIFTASTDDETLGVGVGEEILAHRWVAIPEVLAMPEDELLNPRKLRRILTDYQGREPYTLDCVREDVYGR